MPGTDYRWHEASDGSATFPLDDGGWILVSNSETLQGGASAIRFDRRGQVADAYRILDGTAQNCSGGGTPWGTWLSCEEVEDGLVWECDPTGRRKAVSHPAMGVFKHEAAAVDPRGKRVYLTEDLIDGRFYRFTPSALAGPERRPARACHGGAGRGRSLDRGARPGRAAHPDSPPGARAAPRSSAARGSGATVAPSTWPPRPTTACTPTTSAASACACSTTGSPRAPPRCCGVDQLTANRAGEVFVCEDISTEEIDIGRDRALREGLALPLGHRSGARELGAHGRDLRPNGQPDVLLLTARRRLRRPHRARRNL